MARSRIAARLGQCYVLAGRAVAFGPYEVGTLVHGSIEGYGNPRIAHAWVELPDGSVWEPISDTEYPQIVFRALFHPGPGPRYAREAVLKHIAGSAHWGPWEEA